MDILIRNSDSRPIYEQIYGQIVQAILTGELKEENPLPSIRALAKDLRISVITTKRAYDELERDGFIETVPGKGSFVAGINREIIREENLKQLEALLVKAIEIAEKIGLSKDEVIELVRILWDEKGNS